MTDEFPFIFLKKGIFWIGFLENIKLISAIFEKR